LHKNNADNYTFQVLNTKQLRIPSADHYTFQVLNTKQLHIPSVQGQTTAHSKRDGCFTPRQAPLKASNMGLSFPKSLFFPFLDWNVSLLQTFFIAANSKKLS